jgi:ATPase subunit of ABC transporter with duplicated ATPase domains
VSTNGHLNPGSAKASITQDDLGRKTFVKNLATVIRTYGKSDSLTIGLYGPWGCGKSSLLNFVVEDLAADADSIATLRFNPWNFSQQDTLVSTFFASLSSLIKRSDKSKRAKKVAAILDTFSAVTAPATLAPGFAVIPQTFKQLADAAKGYAAPSAILKTLSVPSLKL